MRGQLAELVRPFDEVASVYIGLDAVDLPVRWRRLAVGLLDQGAPPVTVELLDEFLRQIPGRPKELVAFAAGGKLLWHIDAPGGVRFDRAHYGTPALVLPLLAWLSHRPAYVEVVLDRLGAEVTTVARGASGGATITVTGPDDEITRGGPRGGDQPHFERRAVSSWQHNAGAVAAAAVAELKRVDGELLLIAGQPRMVKLMLERLPKGLHVEVHRIPGGRSPDGSEPDRKTAVAQITAGHAAQRAHPPEDGLSVIGAADTLLALAAGQVRRLYIVDDAQDTRAAWFGPNLLCADSPAEGLIVGRLADVAVRAALLTDAEVEVAQPDQMGPDGIGALCRFD